MEQSWKFIYAADMQPGSPKSFRYKPAFAENWQTARRQIIDRKPEFLLIGGDITRDGYTHLWELEEMKADLDSMKIPYHAIPGNMDTGNKHTRIESRRSDRQDLDLNITAEQVQNFESVYGPSNWSFEYENVRISGFCDMLLGSGLPEEAQLWEWLKEQTKLSKTDHNIWLMHYAMFINQLDEPCFDISDPKQYMDWYFCIDQKCRERLLNIFKQDGATRVITGHIHCRKNHIAEGIHFDLAPGIAMGQWADRWPDGDATLGFLEYTVSGKQIEKKFIPLEQISTRTDGYGQGGHPKAETRDYSLAWEK